MTYYVGTSLDGFIAGPGDAIDFYPLSDDHIAHMVAEYPEVLPTHVREAMGVDAPHKRFDTIIQGRPTYDLGLRMGITSPYAHLRQYVASRSMTESPDPAVTVVADPLDTVRALKREEGGLGIYLAGGGRLAGALGAEIDELIVKIYPVLVGTGTPLFAADFDPVRFTLTEKHFFSSGTAVMSYVRA